MDYFRGFRAMRQDPEWKGKTLVASLLLFSAAIVPIVGQVAFHGWVALVTKQAIVRKGVDGPLPRLDFDFNWLGKLLGVGFKPFLVNWLWSAPLLALLVPMIFAGGVIGFTAGSFVLERGHEDGPPLLLFAIVGVVMLVVMPLAVLAQMPGQLAMLRTQIADDMNVGFKVKDVLRMTRLVLKELLIGNLLLGLVSFPLMFVGMLACYIGIFPVAVALWVAYAHFMAQLYELYLARGGEPLTVAPDPQLPSETGAPIAAIGA